MYVTKSLGVLVACGGLAAAPAGAAVLAAGAGGTFPTLAAAVAAAKAGDTIRLLPGNYTECAVLTVDRLTLEGAGTVPDAVRLSGAVCEGKAILVVRGAGVTLRNLTLEGAVVPEGNGAGVRDESPDLRVDTMLFRANQDGILTGAMAGARLVVTDSRFEANGACEGACAHAIYAGHIGLLRVERSSFFGTRVGHHIKSRALATEIAGCTIEDGPEGTASYMIDIPEGGALTVEDTRLEKGPRSENPHSAIILGEEGVTQEGPIRIRRNVMRNDAAGELIFVVNRTAQKAVLEQNQLEGEVKALEEK